MSTSDSNILTAFIAITKRTSSLIPNRSPFLSAAILAIATNKKLSKNQIHQKLLTATHKTNTYKLIDSLTSLKLLTPHSPHHPTSPIKYSTSPEGKSILNKIIHTNL